MGISLTVRVREMVSLAESLFLRKGGHLKGTTEVGSVAKLVASRATALIAEDAKTLGCVRTCAFQVKLPYSDARSPYHLRRIHLLSMRFLSPLIDRVKNCKVVMLGEASHGTHEFYEWRSRITKILIEQHGFNFVGVEGDWPACQTLNEYIMNFGRLVIHLLHSHINAAHNMYVLHMGLLGCDVCIRSDKQAVAGGALRGFNRWPTWMWANREVLNLTRWLRRYNDKHKSHTQEANEKIGRG